MARKAPTQQQNDGPPAAGAWIITFSDCMTLLLCFFVMLVTFSSFDEVSNSKIAGAFGCSDFDSISQHKRTIMDSIIPPRDRQIDHTLAGSEKPTNDPPKSIQNPREPLDITSTDAYRGKKVFHIASSRLFWGDGCSFVQAGRDYLHMIATFMSMAPCHVVVGEIPGSEERDLNPQAALRRGLDRSWSVMRYLTVEEELPSDRFQISATCGTAPVGFGGQPVMEIVLRARDVYE